MKNRIAYILIICFLTSCGPKPQNRVLSYKNIVIISDMSNRITNSVFPIKDDLEIHKIVDDFKTKYVKIGEKIGDKSSLSFYAFSEKNGISIDLEKIDDLAEKQSFVNSTNNFKNSGLKSKLLELENKVKILYKKSPDPGLDLISILVEKIENEILLKKNAKNSNRIDKIETKFENDVYIFTDGYLEYSQSKKLQNSQFYFGSSEIEKVRKYCQNNKIDVQSALKRNNSLGLPVSIGIKNKLIDLHVYETHERDKDTRFQTYSHVKGLRDNEILEAVWRKWAVESGFKSFEWKKY
jgi:hypothetical protein